MLVSTSYSPSSELEEAARRLAAQMRRPWVARGRQTIGQLRKRYGDQPIMLLTNEGLRLYAGNGKPVFFHPSMAALRVQKLAKGEEDALVAAAGAKPGDAVLDCTAGLAADAIVFSAVVGERGRVVALESEEAIYWLIREGLASYKSDIPGLEEAMRRVQVILADHLDYLRGLPDRSFDIVYFDPMFRLPIGVSASMAPLRVVANHRRLSVEAVREATRVARRAVVLKEHRDSGEFERLGIAPLIRPHTKIAYGVIRL